MSSFRACLLVILLWGQGALVSGAFAASTAPLLAIGAYIEKAPDCADQIVDWHRRYGPKALSGEITRDFYYKVLSYLDWGSCGGKFVKPLFAEMRRTWIFLGKGLITQAEADAKEEELMKIFNVATQDRPRGEALMRNYEARISARLLELDDPRQYFECTFFGTQVRCQE